MVVGPSGGPSGPNRTLALCSASSASAARRAAISSIDLSPFSSILTRHGLPSNDGGAVLRRGVGNPETDSHRTALVDLLNRLNFMFRARANRRRCINGCIAAITWFDKNSMASIDFDNV